MTTVKVARVDCTDPSVQLKCREHHINAFPTVRVYRKGSDQVQSLRQQRNPLQQLF